jgi:hypothetical protein
LSLVPMSASRLAAEVATNPILAGSQH